MAIREGKWRCPNCGNVCRGADLACTGCGATRDKDVQFFLEDEAPEVTDEKLLARAAAGADWLCEFCQTSNRPDRESCGNCGASRDGARSREVKEIRPEAPAASGPQRPAVRPATPARGFRFGLALALLLIVGFCGTLGYFSLRKTEQRVTVSGFAWERSIDVEALQPVREEAWEDALPAGARPLERVREVRRHEQEQVGTERVKVGTKDLGNGFFEDVYEERPVYRDKPVYGTKVRYTIDKWGPARTERASASDRSPRWPELRLAPNEREKARAEKYYVLLQGDKAYRMSVRDPAGWAPYQEGQTYTAVIRGGATVVELRR